MRITSLKNQRVKNIVKLHKRRNRDRQQKMMIEGYRAIERAIDNNYPLDELYACPALFFGKDETGLIRRVKGTGASIIEVDESPFKKMALRERPEGLLAVAPQMRKSLEGQCGATNGFYLIAEAIEKPSNLGAIMRSADGAGVDALIVCDPGTDIFNPNVIRASVGSFFSVPLWQSSSAYALTWCQQQGIQTMAATPHAQQCYTEVSMHQSIALVLGTEQYGLSSLWLEQADAQIRLPMFGQADSLNVAMAATVLLYEAVRQRQEIITGNRTPHLQEIINI